jgi:hypothetical protein
MVPWEIIGVLVALQGVIVAVAYRQGKRSSLSKDVQDNEDSIANLRESIHSLAETQTKIITRLEHLKKRQQVIHDNVIDHNPCASPDCPWCSTHDDDDHDGGHQASDD